jgi:hypothetical protein
LRCWGACEVGRVISAEWVSGEQERLVIVPENVMTPLARTVNVLPGSAVDGKTPAPLLVWQDGKLEVPEVREAGDGIVIATVVVVGTLGVAWSWKR